VTQADATNPNWTATATAVSPSVVAITSQLAQGEAQGSGVVIDASGHILTNNHVVAGAQKLTVTLSDGRTYAAEIRGTDPSSDLAVVTVKNAPNDLKPIALGDSDALKVGDPVMAVGNPLGLAGTVTTGIVSALNRPVTTQAEGGSSQLGQGQSDPVVTNAIQTSAAINPGNSGGALVNGSGQLIGINSSIASLGSSSGQSGNIGIGFAIPVNEAKAIAQQLIDKGAAQHAYLGVTPEDGSASDGSATRTGAQITSVGDGTPAAKAGLQVGDVITAVNGEPVDSALSLVGYIREQTVGSAVKLTLIRDGKTIDVDATLTARSQNG
jgi:putative serine protease PepD